MSLLQWTIEYSHRLERVQGDDVDAAAQQQDNDEEEDVFFLQWQEEYQTNVGQSYVLDDKSMGSMDDDNSIGRDVAKAFHEQ
jgi:hypothetical protein